MDPRFRTLLSWQLRFQSRRMSTWIFGGGYLLVTLVMMLGSPDVPTIPPGQIPFQTLRTIHALAAVIFAIQLAGQSMDDNLSGTLGFLKVAHLESGSWVAFRMAAMILAYLPIWSVRLPIYSLVLSLGGVTLEEVLWLEAVQWVAFLTIGSVALLIARYSTTGSGLAILTLAIVGLFQLALNLPLIALAVWSLIQDRPFSASNHPWAVSMGQLSLSMWFWGFPRYVSSWWAAALGLALHLAMAVVFLRMLARVVFFNVGTEIVTHEPTATKAERKSTTRPSRRVPDDALAWQACHVHSAMSSEARASAVVFGSVCVLVLAFGVIQDVIPRSLVIGVACGTTLVVLAFKPSDCLSRELKGKTLSTLALIPLDGREIYEGWRRGARRLARPGYVAVVVGGILLSAINAEAAPYVWMVLVFAVLLLPEAAFLSNVLARQVSFLEFDFVQLFVNLWVLFLIGVLLAISLPVAIGINPWAGLVTFMGLTLLARSLLLSDFPRYVADRVEREQ